ncbi:MAG: NAD-dependent epimerase/dehydratase family protein [Ruminococcus sp.]|nr:NAD-dependent epimerase/dehydratase family protein [Candidatus Copronaster equi]
MKSAVITGPTGAIGVALCKELLKNNVKVYAVCRSDSERLSNIPNGAQIIFCNLENLDKLKEKIGNSVDAFFHFAWMKTIGDGRNDMYSQNLNVKYTLDAVHAANDLKCKIFIGAGSQAEFGRVDGKIRADIPCRPENGYGMAKLCAGNMSRIECSKFGIDFIWTRVLSVYGPYDGKMSMISSVIRKLLNGEEPELTNGTQNWDYIYSQDAAKIFYALSQKGISGKTYIIANGNSMPLKNYVEILRDEINPDLSLGFGKINSPNPVNLDADISETIRDIDYVPQTDFATGIRNTIEYVKELLK